MKFAELLAAKNRDFATERPVTVVFLGDSVTQGCYECYINENNNIDTVFERKNSYAAKFGEIVGALYPRAQLNLINAGISGGTAQQAVKRLERDVFSVKPDLVIVNFALNDCGYGEEGLGVYKDSMKQIFCRVMAAGAEAVLLTPNLLCDYVSVRIEDKVLKMFAENMVRQTTNGILDRYVETAVQTAHELGVPVCDCYSIWKSMRKNGIDTTALLSNHLNHPTRNMHWLFAFKLAEMLFGR